MSHIVILPLGPHSFAAFIDHDGESSYHQVLLPPNFLAQTGLASSDEEIVVHEALAYLLATLGPAQLPEVLRLTTAVQNYPQLLPALRARLV